MKLNREDAVLSRCSDAIATDVTEPVDGGRPPCDVIAALPETTSSRIFSVFIVCVKYRIFF